MLIILVESNGKNDKYEDQFPKASVYKVCAKKKKKSIKVFKKNKTKTCHFNCIKGTENDAGYFNSDELTRPQRKAV